MRTFNNEQQLLFEYSTLIMPFFFLIDSNWWFAFAISCWCGKHVHIARRWKVYCHWPKGRYIDRCKRKICLREEKKNSLSSMLMKLTRTHMRFRALVIGSIVFNHNLQKRNENDYFLTKRIATFIHKNEINHVEFVRCKRVSMLMEIQFKWPLNEWSVSGHSEHDLNKTFYQRSLSQTFARGYTIFLVTIKLGISFF